MKDSCRRFLFDDLDIRGLHVRLGPAWRQMQAGRGYPPAVARLLGEMSAVTALIGGQLKEGGRLSFQLRGAGPIRTLVIDCDHALRLRGAARTDGEIGEAATPALLGDGQLAMILELPDAKMPFQSLVPLTGGSIAAIFEHYLAQSEQLPTRLFLAASADAAAGLLLQKLPSADARDADGWARIEQLASTVHADELLTLTDTALLGRLFAEETLRVFEPRRPSYHCPEDWEKVRALLRSLGLAEVEAILAAHGEVVIHDDICNRHYRFDAAAVTEVFAAPTRH